jgi:hypothetical protein
LIGGTFLVALVDRIAPGGQVDAKVVLPSASAVGCGEAVAKALGSNSTLQALLNLIAVKAGGASAFGTVSAPEQQSILESVQKERPEAFAALITVTLAHYYAQPSVLTALGWPTHPPQPEGYSLPEFDSKLLKPVLERGAIWRRC